MGSILKFITEGALFGGVRNWIWMGALVAAGVVAFVVIKVADNAVEDTLDAAKEAGAANAVAEGHETTLKQTENANAAGNQVRDDRGNARYDECLRSVAETHRSFCERYKHN
jgi:uncharacterized protein YdbL (DUF1318 family)